MAERAMQTNFSNLVYNLKFDGIICKVLLEVREHRPANVLQLRWKEMIKNIGRFTKLSYCGLLLRATILEVDIIHGLMMLRDLMQHDTCSVHSTLSSCYSLNCDSPIS